MGRGMRAQFFPAFGPCHRTHELLAHEKTLIPWQLKVSEAFGEEPHASAGG